MNSTEISLFALVLTAGFFLLPTAGWFLTVRQPIWVRAVVFVLVVIAGTALYRAGSMATGMSLKAEVARYDRDGDGALDNVEWTPAAAEAMRRYTSDTGRTYAPQVALPVALVWASFSYAGLFLAAWGYRVATGGEEPD